MKTRIAINGFGRIGRCVLRALYENSYRSHLQIVAINELADIDSISYMLRYDSTHGRFNGDVEVLEAQSSSAPSQLLVNDDIIQVYHEEQIEDLDWLSLGVDIVFECTGQVRTKKEAEKHLQVGAKRVLISNPADQAVDKTIVYGHNHGELTKADLIVSNASCSTNALFPVLDTLDQAFGIDAGVTTTIHSAMNDQPTIDAYHHHDLRRTRSSMQNMVPVDTGLAKGIERLLPEMKGCFTAMAVRVPTINVSAIDLTIEVEKATDIDAVNQILKSASENGLSGVLGYTEEPLASSDFNHDRRSAIVDGSQTLVSGKRLVKVFTWFDNEWGFANRMLDVANTWLSK